jgi:prepilin-type N-terminal cleavage/methylation domain-containing protein
MEDCVNTWRVRRSHSLNSSRRAFTLVEFLVAAAVCGVALAAVLGTSFQIARSGVRLGHYSDMEMQARRAMEEFGAEARLAQAIVYNGPADVTLSIPNANGTLSSVTYAWTPATQAFFRVPGTSSAATTDRTILVSGVIPISTGGTGVLFERLDRSGAAATTDAATKFIRITFAIARQAQTANAATERATGVFVLRNKAAT